MEFENLSVEKVELDVEEEDLTVQWLPGMTYGTNTYDNGIYVGEFVCFICFYFSIKNSKNFA
jgi:hypothetical protein